MTQDLEAAIKTEILTERALRYRRNTLALGVVLIGLYAYPDIIDFSRSRLLGVALSDEWSSAEAKRALVLKVLWAALLYHFLIFTFQYCRRDLLAWKIGATKCIGTGGTPIGVPELQMYLGLKPSRAVNRKGYGSNTTFHTWKRQQSGSDKVLWLENFRDKSSADMKAIGRFSVPIGLNRLARRKLLYFFVFEVAATCLVVGFAAVLAFR